MLKNSFLYILYEVLRSIERSNLKCKDILFLKSSSFQMLDSILEWKS